jgi:hypothetical protein
VIDLGTHINEIYQKEQHKVMLIFELPHEVLHLEDGTDAPRVISQQFTYNFGPKSNLRKFLEGWRGKTYTDEEAKAGVDLAKCLGGNAQINVVHTEKGNKTYANIQAIMPLPKGTAKLESFNEHVFFELGTGPIPDTLPEWIHNKINSCLELSGEARTTMPPGTEQHMAQDATDDIPF